MQTSVCQTQVGTEKSPGCTFFFFFLEHSFKCFLSKERGPLFVGKVKSGKSLLLICGLYVSGVWAVGSDMGCNPSSTISCVSSLSVPQCAHLVKWGC